MGVLSTMTTGGFTYPDYPTHLAYVQNIFQTIYGNDIYLGNDSQDGQLCAAFALAIYDNNQQFAQILNALSPLYAQGTQLSSSVLLNGITRIPATNSTATLTITGTNGTVINGAIALDTNNNQWNIANCIIGMSGTVQVLATCETSGAVTALPNTITTINTPIFGWLSVTNVNAATTGQDAESDASLRHRQALSVSLPAVTVVGGILGAIEALTGVTRATIYENSTNTTNTDGIPAHSICAVVEGGSTSNIVNAIAPRKTIGCNTYGTTTQNYTDAFGIVIPISFFILAYDDIYINISITRLAGWTTNIQIEITNSIMAYINSLAIGQDVLYSKIPIYANLQGSADNLTYNITSLTISTDNVTFSMSDIPIAFNYAARLQYANVVYTLV